MAVFIVNNLRVDFAIPRTIIPRNFINQLKYEIEKDTPETVEIKKISETNNEYIIRLECASTNTILLAGMKLSQIFETLD